MYCWYFIFVELRLTPNYIEEKNQTIRTDTLKEERMGGIICFSKYQSIIDYTNEERVVIVLEQTNRTVEQNLEPGADQHIYRKFDIGQKVGDDVLNYSAQKTSHLYMETKIEISS